MKFHIKTLVAAGALLAAISSPALAIDVTKSVTVNKPMNEVWDKIGGWCAIKDWHPLFVECKETREGEDVRRLLTMDGGGELLEKLTGESERSYSYIIEKSPLPVKNYKSTVSVEQLDETKTKITWAGTFDADGKPDKEVKDLFSGAYEAGLKSIAEMMK